MNFNFTNVSPNTMKTSWVALLLMAVVSLAGCGGGSSEASLDNNLPSPVPGGIDDGGVTPGQNGQDPRAPDELALLPKINVSGRQFADPNVLLTLAGTVEAAEGAQIVRTLWIQAGGPKVDIPSPLALHNLILVPDVSAAVQLEFRLVAQDSEGRINSATTTVLVKPVPAFIKVIGGVFNESDGEAVFTIQLNAASDLPVSVAYVTQNGSADSETDYIFTSGEVVFEPGEVTRQVAVELIDDTLVEDNESFSLRVTAINGNETHANVGIAIIRDGVEPQQEQALEFANAGPVSIFLGDEFTNEFNSDVSSPGTGAIIYSSSNTEVATVDTNGRVVGVGLGEAQITATKLADAEYLSANASYLVQVISRGAVPEINFESRDTSVLIGETVFVYGYAYDEEDGSLPTEEQIAESSTTGDPITSLRWDSDIDGFLGYGNILEINTLTMGTHVITYSATDSDGNTGTGSIRVLVGNIAPFASLQASSTYCSSSGEPDDCYNVFNVIDSDLNTQVGGQTSWTHEQNVFPSDIYMFWSSATINAVDIYTSEGFPVADYDIMSSDESVLVSVRGNTDVYRSHPVEQVETSQLIIRVLAGPENQAGYGRINEVVVFGESESFASAAAAVRN